MADNAYEELFNCDVIDVNGDRVGSVGQVYLDDQTGQPSWVTVKTGLFGLKETFVPLEQAIVADGKITTPYSTEKIKEAPRVDPDKHLDADEEAQLYNYYGIATIVAVEPDAAAEAASEDDTADEAAKDIVDVQVEATETEPLTEADDLGLAEDLTTAEDAAAAEITQDDVITEVADNDAVAEVTDDDDTDSADLDVTEDDVTGEVIEGAAGQPTEFTTGSAGSDTADAPEQAAAQQGEAQQDEAPSDDVEAGEPTVAINGEDLYDAR